MGVAGHITNVLSSGTQGDQYLSQYFERGGVVSTLFMAD